MMKLVECIPNFSVSRERDEAAFNALVETAQAVARVHGAGRAVRRHPQPVRVHAGGVPGGHRRGGVPAGQAGHGGHRHDQTPGRSSPDGGHGRDPLCAHHGHDRGGVRGAFPAGGRRIWEELGIPSFLYEESATAPGRVNLAKIRKGQFEGMPEKLLEPEWAPDFGQRKIHPTAGIIAIGARMPLVAFNVNLDTDNVEIAKSIAKAIRGSPAGSSSARPSACCWRTGTWPGVHEHGEL